MSLTNKQKALAFDILALLYKGNLYEQTLLVAQSYAESVSVPKTSTVTNDNKEVI
jgi:hypothetical protein